MGGGPGQCFLDSEFPERFWIDVRHASYILPIVMYETTRTILFGQHHADLSHLNVRQSTISAGFASSQNIPQRARGGCTVKQNGSRSMGVAFGLL